MYGLTTGLIDRLTLIIVDIKNILVILYNFTFTNNLLIDFILIIVLLHFFSIILLYVIYTIYYKYTFEGQNKFKIRYKTYAKKKTLKYNCKYDSPIDKIYFLYKNKLILHILQKECNCKLYLLIVQVLDYIYFLGLAFYFTYSLIKKNKYNILILSLFFLNFYFLINILTFNIIKIFIYILMYLMVKEILKCFFTEQLFSIRYNFNLTFNINSSLKRYIERINKSIN